MSVRVVVSLMVVACTLLAAAVAAQQVNFNVPLTPLPDNLGDIYGCARAGWCAVTYPDQAHGVWRLAVNGGVIASAPLIQVADYDISGKWIAYWVLDSEKQQWQLVVHHVPGQGFVAGEEIYRSGFYDALCESGPRDREFKDKQTRLGPTEVWQLALEGNQVATVLNQNWKTLAMRHAVVADGAAYFVATGRGPEGPHHLPQRSNAHITGVGAPDPAVPDWQSIEPASLKWWPGSGVSFKYEQGGSSYTWAAGKGIGPSGRNPVGPVASADLQSWAMAFNDAGFLRIVFPDQSYRTDIAMQDADRLAIFPPTGDSRSAWVGLDRNNTETLYHWTADQIEKVLTTEGEVEHVECSADGSRWIAIVEEENGCQAVDTGKQVALGKLSDCTNLHIAPDGKHWLATFDAPKPQLMMDGTPVDLAGLKPWDLWVGDKGTARVLADTDDGKSTHLVELKLP